MPTGAVAPGRNPYKGNELWDWGVDDARGWVLGVAWVLACGIE